MYNEITVLLMLSGYGIVYLFGFFRVQQLYFRKFNPSNANSAVLSLFLSSLIMSSLNLIHISEIAADALRYFIANDSMARGLVFCLLFFLGMWVFSLVLFHASFVLVGVMTRENEADELVKNNLSLALVHSIILLSLSIIIAPSLVKIAADFIPYPKMPY